MALDYLGMIVFPDHPMYRGLLAPHIIPSPVGDRYSLATFFGNLACLQNIAVPALGSNGALWSLSNEFWYYAIFPLLAVPLWKKIGLVPSLASVSMGCLVLYLVGVDHAFYFVIWLLGTGIALLGSGHRFRLASWSLSISCVVLFSAVLLTARFRVISDPRLINLLVAAAFALLVLALLQWQSPCNWPMYRTVASRLAGFSYSLYVFHLPILVFLAACMLRTSRWHPSGLHLVYGLSLLVLVALITYSLSQLTEAHTDRVRRFLMNRAPTAAQAGRSDKSPASEQLPSATGLFQQARIVDKASIP
jgi:peptidoglycan/LPS O-acetylase OafA/YrhL